MQNSSQELWKRNPMRHLSQGLGASSLENWLCTDKTA